MPAPLPESVSLKWDFAYIPLILLTVGLTAALYPQMPEQIPNHADFAGNVNGYMTKSPLAVMWPVFAQLAMAAVMVFVHAMLNKGPTKLEKDASRVARLAAALLARAWGGYIVVLGLTLVVCFGLLPIQAAGIMGLGTWGVIMTVAAVLGACVVPAVLLARYGTDGMKAIRRLYGEAAVQEAKQNGAVPSMKWSIAYWNPDDSRILVPNGFMSWTFNFARPASWAIIAGIVLLTVGIVVACVVLS